MQAQKPVCELIHVGMSLPLISSPPPSSNAPTRRSSLKL